MAALYRLLRELGDVGYQIPIAGGRMMVVGSPKLVGPLLDRLRWAKLLLLQLRGGCKPGDDLVTWPDRVYREIAKVVTAGIPESLTTAGQARLHQTFSRRVGQPLTLCVPEQRFRWSPSHAKH